MLRIYRFALIRINYAWHRLLNTVTHSFIWQQTVSLSLPFLVRLAIRMLSNQQQYSQVLSTAIDWSSIWTRDFIKPCVRWGGYLATSIATKINQKKLLTALVTQYSNQSGNEVWKFGNPSLGYQWWRCKSCLPTSIRMKSGQISKINHVFYSLITIWTEQTKYMRRGSSVKANRPGKANTSHYFKAARSYVAWHEVRSRPLSRKQAERAQGYGCLWKKGE